jgi:hypothetical protein
MVAIVLSEKVLSRRNVLQKCRANARGSEKKGYLGNRGKTGKRLPVDDPGALQGKMLLREGLDFHRSTKFILPIRV